KSHVKTVGDAGRRSANLLGGLRRTIKQRDLLMVSFGGLLISLTFAGAITTYFPIYGDTLHLSETAIGSMFAVRALVSAIGRFPNGLISRLVGHQAVMLVALLVDMLVMFTLPNVRNSSVLTALLALEGLAFGAYLVSGQTYVAEHSTIEFRGAAVGVYS